MKSVFGLKRILAHLSVLVCIFALPAFGSDVYIAQTASGSDSGSDCSNAHSAMWFNTAGNWGTGAGMVNPGATVHLCGTFTGTANSTMLTAQASGTNESPITIKFETGAKLEAPYWSARGAINLNGKSYFIIDGGTTCGQVGKIKTACNGIVRNTLAGSSGLTCPGGVCTTVLNNSTGSSAIFSEGDTVGVEIKNLQIGPMYVRQLDTNQEGFGTSGIAIIHGSNQNYSFHNNVIEGTGKSIVISISDGASGTLSGYHIYNNNLSNLCWGIGIGKGSNVDAGQINDIQIYENEIYDWRWAKDNVGGACHTNGTMLFNGDGYTIYSLGYIGDANSKIYNNYLHGSLTGGYSGSSPSGFISVQDNAGPLSVFNNIIIDTETGVNGGGAIYFNGLGGGGQKVYNNTVVRSSGSCLVAEGLSRFGPVVAKNNIWSGCSAAVEIRPDNPAGIISDYNVGYKLSYWMVYNSAIKGNYAYSTLSAYQAFGQEIHSLTSNPNLDANYVPQAGSSAIDRGVALGSPYNVDRNGTSRPQGSAWDIGAYEYIGGSGYSSRQPLPVTILGISP